MIEFHNVGKTYEDTSEVVFQNLDFEVKQGGYLYITGESGSGKSTIMKLILREIEATSGKIQVDGQNLSALSHREIPKYRRQLGVIFQDFNLIQNQTVYENVALAQQIIGMNRKKSRKQVISVLALLNLEEQYNRYPCELSGGQQQKVCLARALVNRPKYLLADEPTGNLDPENAEELMQVLEKCNRRGTTILCATHNHELIKKYPHQVLEL